MPAHLHTPAPDFTLPNQHNQPVRLSGLRGRPVVVFFYPRNHTPACTAEACSFRDHHAEFVEAGITVLGISSGTTDSHAGFAGKHRLPFDILADSGGEVRREWGVPRTLGILPGRVTYVIDSVGFVQRIIRSQVRIERHISESLAALRVLMP